MIRGYVGLIGHGKTMLAVREAVTLARRRGAILASNIEITAPGVDVFRLSVGDDGLDGVHEVLARARAEARGVVVLVDEIGIVLPARYWQTGMSLDLMWAVSQSRKMATDFIYTAQSEEQVDAFVRRLTNELVKVRAYPAPSLVRREAGKRPWFFVVSRWLPGTVDKDGKRLGRGVTRYRREHESWYDTDQLVRPPARLRSQSRAGSTRPGSGGQSRGSANRHPEGAAIAASPPPVGGLDGAG